MNEKELQELREKRKTLQKEYDTIKEAEKEKQKIKDLENKLKEQKTHPFIKFAKKEIKTMLLGNQKTKKKKQGKVRK